MGHWLPFCAVFDVVEHCDYGGGGGVACGGEGGGLTSGSLAGGTWSPLGYCCYTLLIFVCFGWVGSWVCPRPPPRPVRAPLFIFHFH